MYEIHSVKDGVPQAIKRPDAASALAEAGQREMDAHVDIVIKGSDGRSFSVEEFQTEAGGEGQRDASKGAGALDAKAEQEGEAHDGRRGNAGGD